MSMSVQSVAQRNTITLQGSAKLVTEYFAYAVNNILYQRGVYPPETFEQRRQYGLAIMVTANDRLAAYLANVLEALEGFLEAGKLHKLVLVIAGTPEGDVMERWTFDVRADKAVASGDAPPPEKDESEIMAEIAAVIRQITASVTFLPLINRPCSFDLLVYTDKGIEIPLEWEDSDPRMIEHAENVRLRSFSTKVHQVDTMVTYKVDGSAADLC